MCHSVSQPGILVNQNGLAARSKFLKHAPKVIEIAYDIRTLLA
jgi:hypothetical protein